MPKPLGKEYFSRYGAHTPGYQNIDYSKSWRDYTFAVDEVVKAYRKRFNEEPKTFLDIGAADGRLLKQALRHGLKARGIEHSSYILDRIKDRKIRLRIKKTDAVKEIRSLKPESQDIIVECVAQYLSPVRRDRYLKTVVRACSGMVCLLVDARGYDGNRSGPHTAVRTYETKTWWKRKMLSLGFKKCEEDFYFFKK